MNDKFINIGYIFTNAAGGPIDLNKINNIIKGGGYQRDN
ncbi:integrase [Staphylococcus aureus subsp. aureus CIG1176]|nr:integrase [Staphylococcus aureus subsp. aureus CIG1176]